MTACALPNFIAKRLSWESDMVLLSCIYVVIEHSENVECEMYGEYNVARVSIPSMPRPR